MSNKKRLERVNVPRPCSISWESMTGSEKARACSVCNRQVYDLFAMTSSEAERLLDCRGERLCVRFSRGADGKIMTADRLPTYLPQRRPFAGLSVAALAAFIGVSQPRVTLALTPAVHLSDGSSQATAAPGKQVGKKREGTLSGIVHDVMEKVAPNVTVVAVSESTGEKFTTQSGEDGKYSLPLPQGTYTVRVTAPGFGTFVVSGVKVRSGRGSKLDATVAPPILGEVVDIPYAEPNTFVNVLTAPFRGLKRLFGR